MPSLDADLRTILEKAITEARDQAEKAAAVALIVLAVDQPRPFQAMNKDQRSIRNALREKVRQLGSGDQSAGLPLLIEEVAYAQWHLMLFARFLAGNDLLIHSDEKVQVTLEDCEELARQEGDLNRWMTAARYASSMLPGIFRRDDPSMNLELAPEGRQALENALASIPQPVFTSDDGLGWVYQFWQSKKKKEVSASGRKIEKLDLAAYSQLFTEDYMVRFLLENSLGAWWASRHPDSPIVKRFQYLRYREDGTPASGTFPEWPETAAEITVMDPCCGSGHFLVSAFEMLRQMRMEEEGLTARDAGDAVVRDNLFGLEIDPRCVQIAAFALAFAAWKAGGYRELPTMNVACSGIAVRGQLERWTRLAGDDTNMQHNLGQLHGLFVNAPDLGSLINPATIPVEERMFAPNFASVAPLLENALEIEKDADPVAAVFGNTALGVARAGRTSIPAVHPRSHKCSVPDPWEAGRYPKGLHRTPALGSQGGPVNSVCATLSSLHGTGGEPSSSHPPELVVFGNVSRTTTPTSHFTGMEPCCSSRHGCILRYELVGIQHSLNRHYRENPIKRSRHERCRCLGEKRTCRKIRISEIIHCCLK